MLLNYDEVRVGKTLVEFFTLQHFGEIQRFVKEPAYPKMAKRLVKFGEV